MERPDLSIRFLFRQDRGRVSRQIWWAGTLGLALILAAMTDIWLLIGGGAARSLEKQTPLFDPRTALVYTYLVVFALAVLLIAVCHYNLSAKRLRDRGRLPGLAGILPLAALLTGAAHWMQGQLKDVLAADALPDWSLWLMDGAMLLVLVWVVAEMGIGLSRPAAR